MTESLMSTQIALTYRGEGVNVITISTVLLRGLHDGTYETLVFDPGQVVATTHDPIWTYTEDEARFTHRGMVANVDGALMERWP